MVSQRKEGETVGVQLQSHLLRNCNPPQSSPGKREGVEDGAVGWDGVGSSDSFWC